MIYFGIPLRSKASSTNWEQVCVLFNRTLWSVYNQTHPDFKIIVACHEKPELTKQYDHRVEFIQVDIPFPENLSEQMCDKGYKVHTIAKLIREYGGGFTMIVDADDLISNRIVNFIVNNKENQYGWYVKAGYILYLDKMKLKYAPKFPSVSNCIINYTPDLLPDTMDNAWSQSDESKSHIILKGHSIKTKKYSCASIGRPIKPIPFNSAIYVLGTGDNHSTLNGQRSIFRRVFDAFTPNISFSVKMKKEFSIDWI